MMDNKPAGLQTETVRSAMERADRVSRPDGKSYSGVMTRNKDLRHVVLMVGEYRKAIAEVERLTAENAMFKDSDGYRAGLEMAAKIILQMMNDERTVWTINDAYDAIESQYVDDEAAEAVQP